jgi:hypothetical protein
VERTLGSQRRAVMSSATSSCGKRSRASWSPFRGAQSTDHNQPGMSDPIASEPRSRSPAITDHHRPESALSLSFCASQKDHHKFSGGHLSLRDFPKLLLYRAQQLDWYIKALAFPLTAPPALPHQTDNRASHRAHTQQRFLCKHEA